MDLDEGFNQNLLNSLAPIIKYVSMAVGLSVLRIFNFVLMPATSEPEREAARML